MNSGNKPNGTLDSLKMKLFEQGLRKLSRALRETKTFEEKEIVTAEELKAELKKANQKVTQDEVDALLLVCQSSGPGFQVDCVLKALRVGWTKQGQMSARRQSIVDKAYLKLDKNLMGYLSVIDLRNVYNAAIHPHVQAHRMTEEQAFQEFLDHFHKAGKEGIVLF